MEIKIKDNMIEISTSENIVFSMSWQEMRELEQAFKIIREIQRTTKIQNIELTV